MHFPGSSSSERSEKREERREKRDGSVPEGRDGREKGRALGETREERKEKREELAGGKGDRVGPTLARRWPWGAHFARSGNNKTTTQGTYKDLTRRWAHGPANYILRASPRAAGPLALQRKKRGIIALVVLVMGVVVVIIIIITIIII